MACHKSWCILHLFTHYGQRSPRWVSKNRQIWIINGVLKGFLKHWMFLCLYPLLIYVHPYFPINFEKHYNNFSNFEKHIGMLSLKTQIEKSRHPFSKVFEKNMRTIWELPTLTGMLWELWLLAAISISWRMNTSLTRVAVINHEQCQLTLTFGKNFSNTSNSLLKQYTKGIFWECFENVLRKEICGRPTVAKMLAEPTCVPSWSGHGYNPFRTIWHTYTQLNCCELWIVNCETRQDCETSFSLWCQLTSMSTPAVALCLWPHVQQKNLELSLQYYYSRYIMMLCNVSNCTGQQKKLASYIMHLLWNEAIQ